MAMSAKELKDWANTLPDDWTVAIDDGGLTLLALEDSDVWIEIGGVPEADEDQEETTEGGESTSKAMEA